MTNEELAVMAQSGDTKALHALYEQTHKLIYYILNRHIAKNLDRMAGAGVTADDVSQLAYFVLLDAVAAYKPDDGLKLQAYLNFPAQNRFNELVGYRTARQRKEPLNVATSLDEPIRDGEGGETLRSETIECTAATRAFEDAEDSLYTRQLHDMLEGLLGTLPEEQAAVIRAHYYQRQTVTEIGEQLGVKPHHVRHAEYMGLRAMRRHQRKLEPFREQIISTHALHGTGFQCWKERGSVQERITILLEEMERQRSGTC